MHGSSSTFREARLADIGTHLATQLALAVGILAALSVGPGLALFFLLRRKARRRAAKRSPLGIKLLRGPGHTVREQLDEATYDMTWDLVVISVIPLLVLAIYLAQAHTRSIVGMLHLAPLYAIAALGVVVFVLLRMLKRGEQLDRLKTGYDAEVAVGQELDRLMRQGAYVFHDVPGENFNVDHVVVSHAGVFAIETKGYTKLTKIKGKDAATVLFDGALLSFPGWTTSEPLEQADRQAQWVAKWVSRAVAERVEVRPVLALPGWFVKRDAEGPVRVVSGGELPWLLRDRRPVLPTTLVDRIAHQLEQRCRDVEPSYKREPK
jgi:hypothetical protein